MISAKDLRLLLPVALVACCWAAPVGPWTLKSDFENGMRQGWETYPLAEDAGYDPTLDPVTYQGRKALERHKAPNRDGEFRLGFVRKARVIAGSHPHLTFSYSVPSPGPVRLEVGIFYGDTPKLISLTARTGAWAQASLALPGIADDAKVRAISITAVFAAAQEGRQERFLIDDVQLSAMREKDLEITQPTNLWDEDRRLHYVRRSYLPGQELAVTTNTSQVNVKLFDPKNRLVEEHPATGAIHRFSANDEPGLWRAELASAEGTATLLLLLRGTANTGLLFDDLPPATKELLDQVKQTCRDIAPIDSSGIRPQHSGFQQSMAPAGFARLFRLCCNRRRSPHCLKHSNIATTATRRRYRMRERFCCPWRPGRRGFILGLRRTGTVLTTRSG